MITVKLSNGDTLKFPDGMNKQQMHEAIQARYKNPEMRSAPSSTVTPSRPTVDQLNALVNPIQTGIKDFGEGFTQGLANVPYGITQLGSEIGGAVGHPFKNPLHQFDFAPHNIPSTLGNVASFLAGPELFRGLGIVGRMLPKTSQALAPIAASAPARLAGRTLLGAGFTPNAPGLGGALGAVNPLLGKAVTGAFKAAPSIYRGLRPSTFFLRPEQLFKSNLPAEQLAKNLQVTAGTETPLHEVTQLPGLQHAYENVISRIPFAGARQAAYRTGQSIVNRGNAILDRLKGSGDVENLDEKIKDSLQKEYKNQRQLKNKLYKKVNDQADAENLNVDTSNFSNTARRYKDLLDDTHLLKFEPGSQSLLRRLNKYANYGEDENLLSPIVDNQGNEISRVSGGGVPTLEEANLLKGKLSNLANRFVSSSNDENRYMAGIFKNLSDNLKQDIKTALEEKGSSKVQDLYKQAEKNYAENYSPYLDKDIYKYLDKDADANSLVQSFIKTGRSTDRANLINKIIKTLPEEDQHLLGHSYLTRALDENGNLDPREVTKLLGRKSLGPRQYKALFPNKEFQNQLEDYMNLYKKNVRAVNAMRNPETGAITMDILPLVTATGGRNPLAQLGTLGAKMLGARYGVRKLTSPEFREKVVNKMIENQRKGR